MFFHIPGLLRLWNFKSQASAGTSTMESISVDMIPTTSVNPTERIGAMLTICGAINTEKPTIVVRADKKTATPVEPAIFVTHSM